MLDHTDLNNILQTSINKHGYLRDSTKRYLFFHLKNIIRETKADTHRIFRQLIPDEIRELRINEFTAINTNNYVYGGLRIEHITNVDNQHLKVGVLIWSHMQDAANNHTEVTRKIHDNLSKFGITVPKFTTPTPTYKAISMKNIEALIANFICQGTNNNTRYRARLDGPPYIITSNPSDISKITARQKLMNQDEIARFINDNFGLVTAQMQAGNHPPAVPPTEAWRQQSITQYRHPTQHPETDPHGTTTPTAPFLARTKGPAAALHTTTLLPATAARPAQTHYAGDYTFTHPGSPPDPGTAQLALLIQANDEHTQRQTLEITKIHLAIKALTSDLASIARTTVNTHNDTSLQHKDTVEQIQRLSTATQAAIMAKNTTQDASETLMHNDTLTDILVESRELKANYVSLVDIMRLHHDTEVQRCTLLETWITNSVESEARNALKHLLDSVRSDRATTGTTVQKIQVSNDSINESLKSLTQATLNLQSQTAQSQLEAASQLTSLSRTIIQDIGSSTAASQELTSQIQHITQIVSSIPPTPVLAITNQPHNNDLISAITQTQHATDDVRQKEQQLETFCTQLHQSLAEAQASFTRQIASLSSEHKDTLQALTDELKRSTMPFKSQEVTLTKTIHALNGVVTAQHLSSYNSLADITNKYIEQAYQTCLSNLQSHHITQLAMTFTPSQLILHEPPHLISIHDLESHIIATMATLSPTDSLFKNTIISSQNWQSTIITDWVAEQGRFYTSSADQFGTERISNFPQIAILHSYIRSTRLWFQTQITQLSTTVSLAPTDLNTAINQLTEAFVTALTPHENTQIALLNLPDVVPKKRSRRKTHSPHINVSITMPTSTDHTEARNTDVIASLNQISQSLSTIASQPTIETAELIDHEQPDSHHPTIPPLHFDIPSPPQSDYEPQHHDEPALQYPQDTQHVTHEKKSGKPKKHHSRQTQSHQDPSSQASHSSSSITMTEAQQVVQNKQLQNARELERAEADRRRLEREKSRATRRAAQAKETDIQQQLDAAHPSLRSHQGIVTGTVAENQPHPPESLLKGQRSKSGTMSARKPLPEGSRQGMDWFSASKQPQA